MTEETRTDDAAPWKQRFRAPVTFAGLAQANPARGLATSNRSGVFQIYAWDVPHGELRQLTDRTEGKAFGYLSPDGRFVYYLDDRQGNEIGHYVRVPFEGGPPEDVTPEMPPYSSWSLQVSRANNLLGMTLANAEGYHLYGSELGADGAFGETRLLFQSKTIMFGPILSHGAEVGAVASSERSGKLQFSSVAIDMATGERIGELWDGPETSVEPAMFSPLSGDQRLVATTNRTGVRRPLIWNPRTGERIDLRLDGMEGEIVPQDWSSDGARLLLCQFRNATQRLYLYDIASHSATPLQHPGGSYFAVYFGPDGEIWAQWTDSTHPTHLIALDSSTGRQIRTVLPPSDVPPSRPWRSITFTSSDGTPIQGWLAVPEGDGPFPTILETHGGPAAVQTENFAPRSQAWLDHGFAFLTINYRGSTTFGRAFQEQIYGNPGDCEVDDMAAAHDWLGK